jgi:Phage major capsid protein, P2 family
MSSKKEVVKEETRTTIATAPSQSLYSQQQEQEQLVNRALDQTKDNIRKATDEARKEIPRSIQVVNEYQEQTIQATREIADSYIDAQKQIVNSFQSAFVPVVENVYQVFWNNWMSPRRITEIYAKTVSSFADNTLAVTRLANNSVFANMEAFKRSIHNTKDNAKEFSRIGVNVAKTFEQTSRDSSSNFSIGTEGQQQQRLY